MSKLGIVLLVNGLISILGAFFPFQPVIFIFYWLFPSSIFGVKLSIVLFLSVAQVVYGADLLFFTRKQIKWYYLAVATSVIVAILLLVDTLNTPGILWK